MPDDHTMADPMSTDEVLLADLRRIAAIVDAPPPLLASSSRAAFAFGRLDDELARLVQDTALQPVGSRGVDEPRMIAFAAVSRNGTRRSMLDRNNGWPPNQASSREATVNPSCRPRS